MTNYTETQISSMKLAEIVALYNELAATIDAKPVNRFSSKAAAASRFLALQEQVGQTHQCHLEEVEPADEDKTEEPTKDQQVVSIANKPNFRKGSIGEMMFDHITANEGISFQALIDYMVANYKKPRADSEVDAAFIVSTIRYFVRKDALEIK